MDEQPKNNDVFRIRPLEWEEGGDSMYKATLPCGSFYTVGKLWEKWRWEYKQGDIHCSPSKEIAMGACEQHWINELLPALIPVESEKEASV